MRVHSQVKSPLYLYSAFNNTDCVKARNSIKLEDRVSVMYTDIVSVTSSSFSALLDMLRNLDNSGILLTKQSFVVEVMVL